MTGGPRPAVPVPRLHYIYDPLCGWCYAVAPLVAVARSLLPVQAHGGGMMSGPARQRVTPQLRAYVEPHDRRIAELSGQPFGEAYRNGLLRDTSAVFDSTPPIAAMLAAEQTGGRGLDMIARLQTAHYVEGRQIAQTPVLIELAEAIGLDSAAFASALDEILRGKVQAHLTATRQLMAQSGAQGFPAFALAKGGRYTLLEATDFLGRPEDWRRHLQGWLA